MEQLLKMHHKELDQLEQADEDINLRIEKMQMLVQECQDYLILDTMKIRDILLEKRFGMTGCTLDAAAIKLRNKVFHMNS